MLTAPAWHGIENYTDIGCDPRFLPAMRNTLLFALGTVLAGVASSLLLAVLIDPSIRGIYFFRVMFYMPVVSSFAAVAVIFLWIYEPQFGIGNQALRSLGLPALKWLRSPDTALFSIIVMSIGKNMGLNLVIYLAGLQSIPSHQYAAATIDGARRLSKMFGITVPLPAPTTNFVVIVYYIGALQKFTQVFVMACLSIDAIRGRRWIRPSRSLYTVASKDSSTCRWGRGRRCRQSISRLPPPKPSITRGCPPTRSATGPDPG